jgi:hypothetical protein
VAALQATILFVWLFDNNFPLNRAILVNGCFLLLIFLWNEFFGERETQSKQIKWLNLRDSLSIIVGLSITLLVISGPIEKSVKAYHSINWGDVTASLMDTSLDDSSHLSRVNDHIQLNRGVLYKSNEAKNVVLQDTISTYPPGWHSANAVLIESVDPAVKVGGQTMVGYVITKLLWLFILVYSFCYVVLTLYEVFIKSRLKETALQRLPHYVWLLGTVYFFSYYILIEQFKEGFYTFIPVLISLLIILPLLLQLSADKTDNKIKKFSSLLPILLVVANLALSWFLIIPCVILAVVIALIHPASKFTFKDNLLSVWKESLKILPAIILVGFSILAQILIITAPTSQTFKVGVNTPGSIAIQSICYYVLIFVGVLLLYGFVHKSVSKLLNYITLLLSSLIAFSFFIYVFQIITIKSPQYYYYKTLDTALIVALPMAIVGWMYLINYINSKQQYLIGLFIACTLIIVLPLVIGFQSPNDPSLLTYVAGRRSISLNESTYIYDSVSARGMVQLSKRTPSVFFDVPGDIGDNIVASNMLRAIQPVNSCDNAIFSNLLTNNQPGVFTSIKKCNNEAITIVTRSSNYQQVVALALTYGLTNRIKIITVN